MKINSKFQLNFVPVKIQSQNIKKIQFKLKSCSSHAGVTENQLLH